MDPASARDHIAGMERAREILADSGGPSEQLQSRAREAAAELGLGLEPRWRRVLDEEGKTVWQAGLRTARGKLWIPVTDSWEDAFRELGLPL